MSDKQSDPRDGDTDGLVQEDEQSDPQTHLYVADADEPTALRSGLDRAEENAATSLDQPSDDAQ